MERKCRVVSTKPKDNQNRNGERPKICFKESAHDGGNETDTGAGRGLRQRYWRLQCPFMRVVISQRSTDTVEPIQRAEAAVLRANQRGDMFGQLRFLSHPANAHIRRARERDTGLPHPALAKPHFVRLQIGGKVFFLPIIGKAENWQQCSADPIGHACNRCVVITICGEFQNQMADITFYICGCERMETGKVDPVITIQPIERARDVWRCGIAELRDQLHCFGNFGGAERGCNRDQSLRHHTLRSWIGN